MIKTPKLKVTPSPSRSIVLLQDSGAKTLMLELLTGLDSHFQQQGVFGTGENTCLSPATPLPPIGKIYGPPLATLQGTETTTSLRSDLTSTPTWSSRSFHIRLALGNALLTTSTLYTTRMKLLSTGSSRMFGTRTLRYSIRLGSKVG